MTTRHELDRKLIAAVERLARALRLARQRIATRHNLSLLQLQILEHLEAGGDRSVGQLAAEHDVSQPTISDAVAALERKGIATRSRAAADRRVSAVNLTTAGSALADQVAAELVPIVDAARASTEAEEATALGVILEEILRLQAIGVITVNRSCLSCRHYQPLTASESGRCLLLELPLFPPDLRVNCPDHASRG